MSNERTLVASLLKSREAHDKIQDHIAEASLTEQSKVLLRYIREYYDRDPDAKTVDPDILKQEVCRGLPNEKHQKVFVGLIDGLVAMEVSPPNVIEAYIGVQRDAAGAKLATAIAAGKSVSDVRPLLDEYNEWLGMSELDGDEKPEIYLGKSVLEIVQARTKEGGLIKVFPKALNERLDGGLLRGHHVVIFARPEVGKSTLVTNMNAGFLRQGLRVLHVQNEDPIEDVVMRHVGRMAMMTKHEIIDDPDKADEKARAEGYDNLVIASLVPGTIPEIERLVVEYKPDVLVVDQLRNLAVGQDNFTRTLEEAAKNVRTIGKRHRCLCISVTQAGDSASGKSILDMGDVDSSNTGIPAACDVLIGVGMSRDDEMQGRRVLTLCKNKPGANHDSFPVRVNLALAQVSST